MSNHTLTFEEAVMIAVAKRIATQYHAGDLATAQADTRQHLNQMTSVEAALFSRRVAAEIAEMELRRTNN